jgi:hypothetical protein
MSDLDHPAVRYAADRIKDAYAMVRSERPELTPWEAFMLAKQHSSTLIIAANTAIDLAEAERRYRNPGEGSVLI